MPRFEWLGLATGPTSLAYTELQMHAIVSRVAAAEERHWDALAAAYPEHLEAIVSGLGQYLRLRHPAVTAERAEGALRYGTPAGRTLLLTLTEPTRTPHGWGGATVAASRDARAVRLPFHTLFLTFATGWHPEWIGQRSALVALLIDEAALAGLAEAAFADAGQPT